MTTKIIENWAKAQNAGALLPCPRCGKLTMKEDLHSNAFSRRADIYICDKCGMAEAIEDVPYGNPIFGMAEKMPLESWFVCKTVYSQSVGRKRRDGGYDVDIHRRVYLMPEDIDEIMCLAVDGIEGWCDRIDLGDEELLGDWDHEQISRGGSLILHNSEDNKEYTLTLEKLLKGFSIACAKGYNNCLEWFSGDSINVANMDAAAADTIVQCALFGDAIWG